MRSRCDMLLIIWPSVNQDTYQRLQNNAPCLALKTYYRPLPFKSARNLIEISSLCELCFVVWRMTDWVDRDLLKLSTYKLHQSEVHLPRMRRDLLHLNNPLICWFQGTIFPPKRAAKEARFVQDTGGQPLVLRWCWPPGTTLGGLAGTSTGTQAPGLGAQDADGQMGLG